VTVRPARPGVMASDSTHRLYLRDLGQLIFERAVDAKASAGTDSFQLGRAVALYEVVSLMQQQTGAFQLPRRDLGLEGVDPEALL